jgi:hypothetical protein
MYVVKLVSSQNTKSFALFVVRNDASHAPVLVSFGLATYQAYNYFGEYNLYYGPNYDHSHRSYAVSFDRPYEANAGLSTFATSGFAFTRWVERENLNLSYSTDLDMGEQGGVLLNHSLIIFPDHDEYWSTAMRRNVTDARDHGVSLAFLGGNDLYWHIRVDTASATDHSPLIICYKDKDLDPIMWTQPREATDYWRVYPVNQPEDALLGEMYTTVAKSPTPLVLGVDAAPYLAGTGLAPGSRVPGIVGGETDQLLNTREQPRNIRVLATSPVACAPTFCAPSGIGISQATLYTAPGGGQVFDAGTLLWYQGLDDTPPLAANLKPTLLANTSFQEFTYNLLRAMARVPIS